jgi:glycosyltransferase involved in cell wall biosynthesis
VLDVYPQARFVVAGKGPMLSECIDYTLEHGIADKVHFAGFVPEERLAEVYGNSAAYVLPSISEPFGISILEAMTTGVPTIVTKTTGAGEVLDHVLKVDFWDTDEMADMMLGLLSSTAVREEMGRRGGREIHKFSWADCGRETLALYHDLLAERQNIEVQHA